MKWNLILKVATLALIRNKMRTFLTMLGIIIGVGSVISMLAIGNGASASISASIASLGTNSLIISPGSVNAGGLRTGEGGRPTLTPADAVAIVAECNAVDVATPMTRNGAQLIYQNQNWATEVMGANGDFMLARNWPIAHGRFFLDDEVRASAKVCVLGQVVVDNLFAGQDPIDMTIRVGNVPLKVVGVLSAKGASAFGTSQDDIVVVPYTTAMRRLFHQDNVHDILVSAKMAEDVVRANVQIADLLRQRHRIRRGEEDDFNIRTQAEFAQTASQSTRVFTILLGSIASVSLLVGGIGIMNIMLVSVTERIREIGIRMALGARPHDILWQFLVEAVVLSLTGGLLGVGLGYLIALIAAHYSSWPPVVSGLSVLLAFGFSLMVGVFFGIYPAFKASQLDPIEALRNE